MGFDRRVGDDEPIGDLGVGENLCNQCQNLDLAAAEVCERRRRGRLVRDRREALDHPARDGLGEKRVAACKHPDRREQLLRRAVLEQKAARAGAKCLVDVLVEVECRQDENPGWRVRRNELARAASPATAPVGLIGAEIGARRCICRAYVASTRELPSRAPARSTAVTAT